VPYESAAKDANFTVLATIEAVKNSLRSCDEYRYITSLHFGGAWIGSLPLDVTMHQGKMVVHLSGVQMKPAVKPLAIGMMLQLHMPDENNLHLGVGGTWIDVSRDLQPVHYFLNMQARSLGSLGYKVGGLLGEDDHVDVSTPPPGCKQLPMLTAIPRRIHGSARLTP